MEENRNPVSSAIYYNYLQTIEKLKRQHEAVGEITPEVEENIRLRAYYMNKDLINKCFTYMKTDPTKPFFAIFTREGNSRENIANLVNGNPYQLANALTMEFMGRKPRNEQEAALRNAIEATTSKYSINSTFSAVQNLILHGDYNGFTRRLDNQPDNINYRSDLMQAVRPADFADVFLTSIINEHEHERERESKFSELVGKVEETIATKLDPLVGKFGNALADKVESFVGKFRKVVNQKHPGVNNLEVHENVISLLRGVDPVWKLQKGVDSSLGKGLYASADIGNKRENQEDSLLVMYHPQNPKFKMLVVSDGMGGLANGELASSYVVEQTNK